MYSRIAFAILILVLFTSIASASEQPHAYGLSAADILAHPVPELNRLYPNDTLLSRNDYRQINGEVQLFDAPDGTVTASYPSGTYFVSLQQVQNGGHKSTMYRLKFVTCSSVIIPPLLTNGAIHNENSAMLSW